MPTDIYDTSRSFFEYDKWPVLGILPLQADPSAPQVTGLDRESGMLLPDRFVGARLDHFPYDLYDLRDSSHLVKFLKALLGESGVGQLRKRSMVCQFQNTLQGSHFYDLDRFYGAIFGVSRFSSEVLPINPMEEVACEDEWDDIHGRDAAFRTRIHRLASAINMGATVPGLRAAAEAVVETQCDLYETWSLLDTYGEGGTGRLWLGVEALGTWNQIEAERMSWSEIEDITVVGRSKTNSRAEVIIHPLKDYDSLAYEDGPEEAARQQAEDVSSLIRVLNVLKPANVLLTVDPDGVALHKPTHLTNLVADSNYWEVTTKVVPRPDVSLGNLRPYPQSLRQQLRGILYGDKRSIPKPPFSVQQAAEWSYNPEIVAVRGYSWMVEEDYDKASPGAEHHIVDRTPGHIVTYKDGKRERFSVDRAILDPRRALAARYASEGILVSHPYSGDRKKVDTHG